jgi:hypothetical protein
MQWKVVRRLAESLGYARLGRGEVQGPCFDNVLQARDVVMEEGGGGGGSIPMQWALFRVIAGFGERLCCFC